MKAAKELPAAVVVHAGARDRYQLPFALAQAGLLRAFATNVFSATAARRYFDVDLGSRSVVISKRAAAAYFATRFVRKLDLSPYSNRWLGAKARSIAALDSSAVFSCSYYAYEAFKPGPSRPAYRFLFQVHPHPATVASTLLEEIERVPSAEASLRNEIELRGGSILEDLGNEPLLANGWVAASSHTARTLTLNGVDPVRVHVVPYGVDPLQYPTRTVAPGAASPFTIMFLGSIVQRKGISYLLDAVRLLDSRKVRIRLRGRGFVDWELLSTYKDLELEIALNRSTRQIVEDLHTSDLFVLPSLEEGFGHAILEAMSCGVPALVTERSCGPDIITHRSNGFITAARCTEDIAAYVDWSITHRDELAEMGRRAACRARQFTWARFREGVRSAYRAMVESASAGIQ